MPTTSGDPEKLERQMRRFEARPELDLCVTYLQNFWITELKTEENRFKATGSPSRCLVTLHETLLARISAFDKVGMFDESLKVGDPTDWFLRAGERGLATEIAYRMYWLIDECTRVTCPCSRALVV